MIVRWRRHISLLVVLFATGVSRRVSVSDGSLVAAIANGDEAIEGDNSEESMKASREGEASLGTQSAVADTAKHSTGLDSAGSSLPAPQPPHGTNGLFGEAVSRNARLAWGVAAAEACAFLLVVCLWQSCSARLCPKHSSGSRWQQAQCVNTKNHSQAKGEAVPSALSERPGERLGVASGVVGLMLQEDASQLTSGQQQDLRSILEVLEEEGAKRALCPKAKRTSRWVRLDSSGDAHDSSDNSDSSSDLEFLPSSPVCSHRSYQAITSDPIDTDEFKEMVECTDMDETTRRWLQSFASKQLEASPSPMSNGDLVESEPALKEIMSNLSGGLSELLEQFVDWRKFSLARLDELSSGSPLLHSSLAAMHNRGLLAKLTLPGKKVCNFVAAIEGKYNRVAFHNSLHAADAVQAAHSLMGNSVQLQDLEVFSTLIAALVIDVGHPGVSNEFRAHQRDEGALIYNDQCVNENMHCAIAYQTAAAEACNWLSHLPLDTERRLRALLVPMVLSTDTCQHARILEDARAALCRYGVDVLEWPSLLPLLELLVHSSDLAGRSARGPEASARAFDRFLEELFLQGDREKELHLPPSPLCDRASISALDAHWRFLDLVAAPTFRLVGRFFEAEVAEEQLEEFHGLLAEQTGQVGADMAWVLSDMGQRWDPTSKELHMVQHRDSLPLQSAMARITTDPGTARRGVRFTAIEEESSKDLLDFARPSRCSRKASM